ncbi:hypothetical protein BDZ91DRAFT_850958 [Kalaharituber pfeilii]|nr:hypothetical protein BDZ91DRAFT_850958 [Kalaharituber pfeilii]
MGKISIHDTSNIFHTQTGRIYQGRMTFHKHSPNDHVVVIFHGTIAVSQPVSVYWQFGANYKGDKNENHVYNCIVHAMEITENGYKVQLREEDKWYRFTAEMSEKSMTLTMSNKDGYSGQAGKLELSWPLS